MPSKETPHGSGPATSGATPFKRYKLWPCLGGVRTPLIVSCLVIHSNQIVFAPNMLVSLILP
ncbi:hypothetical protein AB7349_21110, partial [Providencia rettgeri]